MKSDKRRKLDRLVKLAYSTGLVPEIYKNDRLVMSIDEKGLFWVENIEDTVCVPAEFALTQLEKVKGYNPDAALLSLIGY